jgi:hypothetical protein
MYYVIARHEKDNMISIAHDTPFSTKQAAENFIFREKREDELSGDCYYNYLIVEWPF